jgi:uncharacterized protein YegJ (DUF2314 family)
MAKPIPVFSFVFAAYAATSAAPQTARSTLPRKALYPSDPFLSAWRKRAASGGSLYAKVGLRNADLGFAVRSSGEIYEGFWLGDIVETRLGFIGAAMEGQDLPARIKPGQRLRFHQINVFDWKLGDCAKPCPTTQRECVNRHPRNMLADLTEIVGA